MQSRSASPHARLRTISYGEERPSVHRSSDESCWAHEPPRPLRHHRPHQRRLNRTPTTTSRRVRRAPLPSAAAPSRQPRGCAGCVSTTDIDEHPDPAQRPAASGAAAAEQGSSKQEIAQLEAAITRADPGAAQGRSRHAARPAEPVGADRAAAGQARGHQLPPGAAVAADRGDQPGPADSAQPRRRRRRAAGPRWRRPIRRRSTRPPTATTCEATTTSRCSASSSTSRPFPRPTWPTTRPTGSASATTASASTARRSASSTSC